MLSTYTFLLLAVLAETIGTMALQASHQFTKFWPSLLVVISYSIAFYLLSLVLRTMPVGIMYAMWSGLGIVFITIMGFVIYKQRIDLWGIIGITLITLGIIIIHFLSKSAHH